MDAPSGLREIRTDLVWIHQRLRRNDGERTFLCLLVISTTFVGDLSVRDGSVWQVLVGCDVVVLWCCLKDSVAIVSSFPVRLSISYPIDYIISYIHTYPYHAHQHIILSMPTVGTVILIIPLELTHTALSFPAHSHYP
jgi:hypothetical protein